MTEPAQASPEQTGEPDGTTAQETEPAGNEPASTRGRGAWAAVAALCVVLGAIASVLGARAVARNDTSSTRTAFAQSSTAIATTVKLAIQRQEELTVAASTYFAANPKATPTEFARWVTWARTQRRYPELDALGLLPAPAAARQGLRSLRQCSRRVRHNLHPARPRLARADAEPRHRAEHL